LPQFDPVELAALKPLTTIKNITLEHGENEQKRKKKAGTCVHLEKVSYRVT